MRCRPALQDGRLAGRWDRATPEPVVGYAAGTHDAVVAAALIGLAGVIVGLVGSLLVARLTAEASARVATAAHLEERLRTVRELAVDAHVDAVEAIAWLSAMHVEDSVDPKFADPYEPNTARAVDQLRSARRGLNKAAALSGGKELADLAAETARLLGVLDQDWHGCQEYRRRIVQQDRSAPATWHKDMFTRHYEGLLEARLRLTGFPEHTLPREEVRQGGVAEDSVLYRLRQAIAAS